KNIEILLEKEKELLKQNFIEIDGKKRINTHNIINLWQFGEFSPEDLDRLSQFGFTIFPCRYPDPKSENVEWQPAPYEQFFWLYENNNYYGVANFITTDAILQLYHIFLTLPYETSSRKNSIQLLRCSPNKCYKFLRIFTKKPKTPTSKRQP
ncbi:MAG TPA: DUF3160 domain-containing protein, partial [Atribacter sp.]|nr:DUF3160 domain-containing protein [Atribacter sp.]